MAAPEYSHTQRGPIGWVLFAFALAVALGGVLGAMPMGVRVLLFLLSGLFFILGTCFQTLTVRSTPTSLHVAFGPFSVFETSIRYADIQSAERTRSDVWDGIGIHYLFGRGWIWNLWGRDCLRLTLKGGVIRVGTDDAENLLRHVQQRMELSAQPTQHS